MSKETTPKTAATAESKKETAKKDDKTTAAPTSGMTAEEATALIVAPYVTEKTFNQIEKENKLAFIVAEKANKKEIMEAIQILYEAEAIEVNTTRTIRGKKAFVRFKGAEGARELATKLGLV
jgi:large subunit ribosomal protein L23